MKKTLCVMWLVVAAFCSTVSADYETMFPDSSVSNDFKYGQIGQHGTDGYGVNNSIIWSNGFVRLASKYTQQVSRFLAKGDDGSGLNNGRFTNTVYATLSFNYYSGDSSNAWAEVAVAANSTNAANNYPVYYARVAQNALLLYRHHAYNVFAIVGSNTLTTVSGTGMKLRLAAVRQGGTTVDLTATLLQNNVPLSELTYSDAAGYLAGYTGFGGGDAYNTGTTRGIDITAFSVGKAPPRLVGTTFSIR